MYVTCDDSYNSYFGNTRRHVENHEKSQKTTPRNTINLLLKMDEATQKTQKNISVKIKMLIIYSSKTSVNS